jgi:beta-glucanase (GH16 family)
MQTRKNVNKILLLLLMLAVHEYCNSQNMRYTSSRVETIIAKDAPGATHTAVQRLVITTTGASNPLALIKLAATKPDALYFYYSGNDTSIAHAQLIETIHDKNFIVLKNVPSLQQGENNFWICLPKSSNKPGKSLSQVSSFDLGLPDYQRVWADEFDKDTLNASNWGFEKGFVRNEEHQWYQPDNATCSNGILTIEAKREKKPNPTYIAGSTNWRSKREFIEYTSASMRTRDKQQWKYGRFELRAKIDTAQGYWPAWWSLGVSRRWPENGEIDMMEYYKGKVLANFAVAGENPRAAHWFSKTIPVASFPPGWKDQFHIWRMDWDEQGIALYLDDVLLNYEPQRKLYNRDGSGFYPFQQEHYLLINLAIGGMNGGDPSPTKFPLKYEVDYVRVSQKITDKFNTITTHQPAYRPVTGRLTAKKVDGK